MFARVPTLKSRANLNWMPARAEYTAFYTRKYIYKNFPVQLLSKTIFKIKKVKLNKIQNIFD